MSISGFQAWIPLTAETESAGKVFADRSGNGHYCTFNSYNSPFVTDPYDRSVMAVDVDGAVDRGVISDFDEFGGNGGAKFAAFIWVKSTDVQSYAFNHYETGGDQRGWAIRGDNAADKFQAAISTDGTSDPNKIKNYESSIVAFDGNWHHVGFTFDGSLASADRLKLWVDGVHDTSPTKTADDDITTIYNVLTPGYGSREFRIGCFLLGGADTWFFDGALNHAVMFNEIPSNDDIYLLANKRYFK